MFVIRPAVADDLPTLLKLAKMVHFINLPADKDIISAKIARSRKSFAGQAKDARERQFLFVLEDTETESVIGTSAAISSVSWPGWPHVFLQVRRREYYSQDLQQGAVHTTLEFGTDESGPSEVGGLILAPGYRGHKGRLGSLLSLIRLHFIALNRAWFADRVLAELMGPLTPDSRTMLWEYLGRRYINLSYNEADLFCQHSKEFMTSLWPRGEVHASILPAEARALIGKVGEETVAAKIMLERQGFRFNGQVDPFDGGPYLEAELDEIPIVKATRLTRLGASDEKKHMKRMKRMKRMQRRERLPYKEFGFVSCTTKEEGFRAIRCEYTEDEGRLSIPPECAKAIGARQGDRVGLTPLGRTKDLDEARSKKRGPATLSAMIDLPEAAGGGKRLRGPARGEGPSDGERGRRKRRGAR